MAEHPSLSADDAAEYDEAGVDLPISVRCEGGTRFNPCKKRLLLRMSCFEDSTTLEAACTEDGWSVVVVDSTVIEAGSPIYGPDGEETGKLDEDVEIPHLAFACPQHVAIEDDDLGDERGEE